jgi:hypothetical protein
VQPRALELADAVHHQLQRRRKCGMVKAYQVDQSEVATPTRDTSGTVPAHAWRVLTGPNTRYLRVDVLTLGAVSGSGTPYLTLVSTTDPTGATFARVPDAAAPGSVIASAALQQHSAVVEVTPNTSEDVTIEQNSATSTVRILCATLHEHPSNSVDTADDAIAIAVTQFTPGEDIVDAENDDLPLGLQLLRRRHKKILHADAGEVQTTAVGLANRIDLTTRVAGNPPATLHQWDVYPSVNLPETVGVSVTCAVLARTSASTGTVRFAFGSASVDVGGIGALAVYSTTGSCAKLSDTLSYQAYLAAAGTLFVYGRWCWENVEAA